MTPIYSPTVDGIAATADTAGTQANLAALRLPRAESAIVYVWNRSTGIVRAKAGANATALSFPIPAGDIQPFKFGPVDTIGLWCEAGTAAVEIFRGDGL